MTLEEKIALVKRKVARAEEELDDAYVIYRDAYGRLVDASQELAELKASGRDD